MRWLSFIFLLFSGLPQMAFAICTDPNGFLTNGVATASLYQKRVTEIAFSEGVANEYNPQILTELKRMMNGRIFYALSNADSGFDSISYIPAYGTHTAVGSGHYYFSFRETQPGRVEIYKMDRKPSDDKVFALIKEIANRVDMPDSKSYEIHGGFLKGFDLNIGTPILLKLYMKHNVEPGQVLKAFRQWSSGLVEKSATSLPGRQRYQIVVMVSGLYFQIIFEWHPALFAPGGGFENEVPFIDLVSAYPSSVSRFLTYQRQSEPLE